MSNDPAPYQQLFQYIPVPLSILLDVLLVYHEQNTSTQTPKENLGYLKTRVSEGNYPRATFSLVAMSFADVIFDDGKGEAQCHLLRDVILLRLGYLSRLETKILIILKDLFVLKIKCKFG